MQDQRFLFADPALRTVESGHPKKIKGSRKGCLFAKMVDSGPRFARLKIKFHRSALAQSRICALPRKCGGPDFQVTIQT